MNLIEHVIVASRRASFISECEECEFKMRWSKCPGFRDTACKLIDADFIYPEQVQQDNE